MSSEHSSSPYPHLDRSNVECHIRKIAGGLVIITEEGFVTFFHSTAREFLTSNARITSQEFLTEAHLILAKDCLTALEEPTSRDQSRADDASHLPYKQDTGCDPIVAYAQQYWTWHVHLAGWKSQQLPGLVDRYLAKTVENVLNRPRDIDNVALENHRKHTDWHRDIRLADFLSRNCSMIRLYEPESSKAGNMEAAFVNSFCDKSRCCVPGLVLYLAASLGFEPIVNMYLEAGIAPDGRCSDCPTPLQFATMGNHPKIVDILLRRNASTVGSCSIWPSPLMTAVSNQSCAIVKSLLSHGAATTTTTSEGYTPLHLAAAIGNDDILGILLDRHAEVDGMTKIDKLTPLHLAASEGHFSAVKLLTQTLSPCRAEMFYGEIVKQEQYKTWSEHHLSNLSGEFPFIWESDSREAAEIHFERLEQQVFRRAYVDMRDRHGRTALHIAAIKGYKSIVQYLLEQGATFDTEDCLGDTPLQSSSASGYIETVEILLKAGAQVGSNGKRIGCVVENTAKNGHFLTADLLLFYSYSSEIIGRPLQYPGISLAVQKANSLVQQLLQKKAGQLDDAAKATVRSIPLHSR